MNGVRISWFVFLQIVRQSGRWSFVSNVVVINLLNMLALALLFSSVGRQAVSLESIATYYPFFISVTAVSVSLASWESELFSGLGQAYLLNNRHVVPSRAAVAAISTAPMFLAVESLILLGYTENRLFDAITAFAVLIGFSVMGTTLGFCFGFRHEKAVNNMVNLSVWVIALGPGPFFSNVPIWLAWPFPGSLAAEGMYLLEWLKLALFTGGCFVLLARSTLPGKAPMYS